MSLRWTVLPPSPPELLAEFPDLPASIVQLLFHRGYTTQEAIDVFLQADYSRDVYDPFLFNHMTPACSRIYQAIKTKEKIVIHGDYDADGVCASVILFQTLQALQANVEIFLPHREKDGYGLNSRTVQDLHQAGAKLIITCDCGISNVPEVALARSLGLDVIITDHHQLADSLPDANAIIHPRVPSETYPFKELAGGGVAFKLAQGLLRSGECTLSDHEKEVKEKWLLDLVAISSVADMVSLTGETRTLVKYGLKVLRLNQRLGLRSLYQSASIEPETIDEQTIGYQIAPRINAAGRMDHANGAFFLLIESDASKAQEYAEALNQANIQRQRQTDQMVQEAKREVVNPEQSLLFFYKNGWPLGLTGLVAGKLTKIFNRPCLVAGNDGEKIVGSGRSIEGVNILQCVAAAKDLLVGHGGHPQACGFRLPEERWADFQRLALTEAENQMIGKDLTPTLLIDAEMEFKQIQWPVMDYLQNFSPFGQGNKEALFISRQVQVITCQSVGKDGTHLKLKLKQGDKIVPAIAFGSGKMNIATSDLIDIAYSLSINEWNGNREIQLQIKDIITK